MLMILIVRERAGYAFRHDEQYSVVAGYRLLPVTVLCPSEAGGASSIFLAKTLCFLALDSLLHCSYGIKRSIVFIATDRYLRDVAGAGFKVGVCSMTMVWPCLAEMPLMVARLECDEIQMADKTNGLSLTASSAVVDGSG